MDHRRSRVAAPELEHHPAHDGNQNEDHQRTYGTHRSTLRAERDRNPAEQQRAYRERERSDTFAARSGEDAGPRRGGLRPEPRDYEQTLDVEQLIEHERMDRI